MTTLARSRSARSTRSALSALSEWGACAPRRLALLLGVLLAGPGGGAAAAEPLDLRYQIEVGGVRIAELALTVTEAEGGTRSRLVMESVGIAAAWSAARSQLDTVMRRDGEGRAAPVRFDAQHSKRDREREISIRYDALGAIAALELSSQGRRRDSEVPAELRVGTVDPLTALERLRSWLAAAALGRADPLITLPVFDGRKRLDLEARYLGPASPEDRPGAAPLELAVRLIGRYGFDADDELIELPQGERPAPLRVLVSSDAALAPLRVEVPDRRIGPVISLVRDCRQDRCPPLGG
jgi:hypothetical protein